MEFSGGSVAAPSVTDQKWSVTDHSDGPLRTVTDHMVRYGPWAVADHVVRYGYRPGPVRVG
ncbi:Hypothetical predicted protein [Olea europaea subsp. europaea]|uniref:Uncharacterized protein n=1 Tax=Olea europaea subsp. europaea TaxID=158383 RepID=A0A8S0UJW1_OLEEU|nr:Hypothetical predicted protein [Olea europaea subsp. europaea]